MGESHADLSGREMGVDFDHDFEVDFRENRVEFFKEVAKELFPKFELSQDCLEKLCDIAAYIHTRAIYPVKTSGVVIAGFGNNEIFPVVKTYEIEGFIDGRLKYKVVDNKCYKVDGVNSCSIIPFAQEDMVISFIKGINPAIMNLINQYLSTIFDSLPDLLSDDDLMGSSVPAQNIKDDLRESATSIQQDLFNDLEEVVSRDHVNPVLNMVKALPKDELAAMAESLVSLTAFKRKMTESLETVGGPVDVVVISKGDGLVWVKRKLYFPKELNQIFFDKYFREF